MDENILDLTFAELKIQVETLSFGVVSIDKQLRQIQEFNALIIDDLQWNPSYSPISPLILFHIFQKT